MSDPYRTPGEPGKQPDGDLPPERPLERFMRLMTESHVAKVRGPLVCHLGEQTARDLKADLNSRCDPAFRSRVEAMPIWTDERYMGDLFCVPLYVLEDAPEALVFYRDDKSLELRLLAATHG